MKRASRRPSTVSKVRASRDGHEFHEAWTARRSMRLLWPESDLTAIAVEGLSPSDQPHASPAASEIADLTLYYGASRYEDAKRVTIAQFKYSVAHGSEPLRAAHAKPTITKFARAYQDRRARQGKKTIAKLAFEFVTNRPIYPPLLEAIDSIAKGRPRSGEVATQANQFTLASGLEGQALADFAGRCTVLGLAENLARSKYELAAVLVDWSATNDPLARARLGKIREMVRDKAGTSGEPYNLIQRTDVLAALEVSHEDDLLPCRSALPEVGAVVRREQHDETIALIGTLSEPLLIHAAGGIGKTVFMNSLASAIGEQGQIVFFDCFGGGAYRSPEDARHLPERGLMHIANTLAFRGLCDPILPGAKDIPVLVNTFRRRLEQCVVTLKKGPAAGRGVTLFLDAIDNAVLAKRESEDAFPILLLESIGAKPIPGVTLVASCRTERKPSVQAPHREFKLCPFSLEETSTYLRSRMKGVSEAEVKVAKARSGGNPRVLEYLVASGRGVLDQSEIEKIVTLDDLLRERLTQALATARQRGHAEEDIRAFLAGLAVLPPPVPLGEYADAHGLEPSAIESFAADLSPLLERTSQGLTFRDEPTETLVHDTYASSVASLRRLAMNLEARQDVSVYAARALPRLLHLLNDGEQLFELAFDDRIPAAITSTVGKRNVRYARIKAAVLHSTLRHDANHLVRLLTELASVATVDQRGARYLLDNPDLVVTSLDLDATRRLFEARTGWPGTRHARLAIAHALAGQSEEAIRHAIRADDWIRHFFRRDERDPVSPDARPERPDIAAIPFVLLTEGQPQRAVQSLSRWLDWYAHEVSEHLFHYVQLAQALGRGVPPRILDSFVAALRRPGALTAAISFHTLTPRRERTLLTRLARACRQKARVPLPDPYHRERPYDLLDGLRFAAARALALGLRAEARKIAARTRHARPSLWSLRSQFYHKDDVFPFLFHAAARAAATKENLHEKDLLPRELVPLCARMSRRMTGDEFRQRLRTRLPQFRRNDADVEAGKEQQTPTLSYDELQRAEQFLDQQLRPLLRVTRAFADLLAAPPRRQEGAFRLLLDTWEDTRKNIGLYDSQKFDGLFRAVGFEAAFFALRVLPNLKLPSVRRFLALAMSQGITPSGLVRIVALLAKRPALHNVAGEVALQARSLIEAENEVAYRASLSAELARAMLPASVTDATIYFRYGLDQMDAIGSDDSEFTNELLLFAASLRGEELAESDFHTLTNICELNFPEEIEKFMWGAFARGLSKAAGLRVLAKVGRWDDRAKVELRYSLLPCLTALVSDGKLEPEVALALNRLADPVEYWYNGTREFAEVLRRTSGTTSSEIISELVQQYEENHRGGHSTWLLEVLAPLAADTLKESAETSAYLKAAERRSAASRDTRNEHANYRGTLDPQVLRRVHKEDVHDRAALQVTATQIDPLDLSALSQAIERLSAFHGAYDLKGTFFAAIRSRVPFGDRARYIENVCATPAFNLYWKLNELKECRRSWASSTAALGEVLQNQAKRLVRLHTDDLISYGRLSNSHLTEIAALTGVSVEELVLELIPLWVRSDMSVPGAVWLAAASLIASGADAGQGQLALSRLLQSDAAKLTDRVIDGPWKEGLYPKSDVKDVAATLTWRMLGSPHAEARWRGAHSLRSFARFGRWEILDQLVANLQSEETAGPFQAGELRFYYLHARLWLLIALARLALDHPNAIARYQEPLLVVAIEEKHPHVLMRHFAARALLACVEAHALSLPADVLTRLRTVDRSPHERLREKVRQGGGFYHGRPKIAPKSPYEFHLDYDFGKGDVGGLGHVFGKEYWEVEDIMAEIVHGLDPNVGSMYEAGGRSSGYGDRYPGMTDEYHTYGQQLGWHALFFAAGKLLRDAPVTNDSWYDDPWPEWFSHYLLTREDGYWLSDGIDRLPLDTAVTLLEKAKDGLVLTGDRDKILALVGIAPRVGKELVIEGTWYSDDGIQVHISSALVDPDKAQRLARRLIREEPIRVWLPKYFEGEEGTEYLRTEKKEYTPWIHIPQREARLDQSDSLGAPCANLRPSISDQYAVRFSLSSEDRFKQRWKDERGRIVARAEAWGHENRRGDGESHSGLRLLASSSLVKTLLRRYAKELLVLIDLQRYQSESSRSRSTFTHTIAVVRVSRQLQCEYFRGRINHRFVPT